MHNTETILDRIKPILERLLGNKSIYNGLLTGAMGQILSLQQLYLYSNDKRYLVKAEELLEGIFNDLGDSGSLFYQDASLANGLAGFSFLITMLKEKGLMELNVDDELNEIDEILFKAALQQINDNQNDFLLGGIGIIYALSQRAAYPAVVGYLETLVDILIAKSIKTATGSRLINNLLNADEEVVNFSLAHGMCGTALVLIEVYNKKIRQPELQDLITNLINYMLNHQQQIDFAGGSVSYFPSFVKDSLKSEENRSSSRLAWCYGDLNQALLLYRAGQLFKRTDWIDLADKIGAITLKRKENYTGVVDAFFCHGTVGLAEYYRSLFYLTKNEDYNDAHLFWISKTLDSLSHASEQEIPLGILEGADGIALVLSSYLKPGLSNWQKVLLLE